MLYRRECQLPLLIFHSLLHWSYLPNEVLSEFLLSPILLCLHLLLPYIYTRTWQLSTEAPSIALRGGRRSVRCSHPPECDGYFLDCDSKIGQGSKWEESKSFQQSPLQSETVILPSIHKVQVCF